MSKIKLPSKPLGLFVQAAHSWLAKTVEAKQGGVEIRLKNEGGNLSVSAGADGSYLEALIATAPEDIEALTSPLFLDLQSLAAYAFDSEVLSMVVPTGAPKEDHRVGFLAPSFNFRIPQRQGSLWTRNYFDFKGVEIEDFFLDKETFKLFYENSDLPDSFNSRNQADLQVCIDCTPNESLSVFANDMGAYWHTFKSANIKGKKTQVYFNLGFFTPCKNIEIEEGIGFSANGPQSFGSLKSPNSGFLEYRWMQPRYVKAPQNVAAAITNLRTQTVRSSFSTETKALLQNISKACMFLSSAEMKSTSMEMETVGTQYNLKTIKSTGDEVCAEGLIESTGSNIKISVQASAFKDYLSQLSDKSPVCIEVYRDTLLMEQVTEQSHLIYWMPLSVGG